ncbi:MAG TPA: hypothetical protein VF733_02260 [Candidatus Saccharimonadales bacterium]
MKVTKILALASLTGVIAAGAITTPALAWHPKGVIKKSVQNQTSGAALADANTTGTALAAKPGDILKYVIEVSNTGSNSTQNEMHFTKLTDALPAGVQLVSDPAKRTIAEDLGVIKPGAKVTKEYLVKVVSEKDGDVIENKACFTGDSSIKDNPQSGCDVALTKLSVPKKEEPKPVEPPKKEEPKVETPKVETPAPTPEALPQTGASDVIAPLLAVTSGGAAYAGRMLVVKRRKNHK